MIQVMSIPIAVDRTFSQSYARFQLKRLFYLLCTKRANTLPNTIKQITYFLNTVSLSFYTWYKPIVTLIVH